MITSEVAPAATTEVGQLRAKVENLTLAMEHRGTIGQARGIVMATYGISGDAALAVMIKLSQSSSRKLWEIAENIVADFEATLSAR